jgi:uncharacterized protein YmfQ (DUF2313 family)
MTSIPNWSTPDFINKIYQYLPQGDAWPDDPASELHAFISGLAPTHQRLASAAAYTINDTFPATTVSLIPEWFSVLGLPDPYFPATTTAEMQAQIVARLTASGGCSASFYQSFVGNMLGTAASNIIVTGECPFLMGTSTMGSDFNDWTAVFYWNISIPSSFSSMLPLVEYEVGRIAPAYGVVSFTTH